MPRYGLSLRPIYDPNEQPWQQSLASGIGSAIDEWQRKRELERQEGNQVRAMGGVETPRAPQPSPMDRLRGIGGAIGRIFSGPSIEGRQRDGMPAGTMTPPPEVPPVAGVPAREPFGTDPFSLGSSGPLSRIVPPRPPSDAPAINPALMGGDQRAGATRGSAGFDERPRIGAAIQPYDYEGVRGRHYAIDPLYGARVQAEGRMMTDRVEDERKIQSLVDAGMDPKEARARVLNNVVRYDETFGQQRASRGGLTFEQRQSLQREHDAEMLKRAKLAAAGRGNTAEARQNALRLRELELQLSADRFEAQGLESAATATERTVPRGTDRIVEESQPGGKERIAGAVTKADSLRQQAGGIRRGAADRVRGALGGKRTISQAQYDAAIAKGATDAQIEAAYNIPANVKRKR